jgi:hypothetical protein
MSKKVKLARAGADLARALWRVAEIDIDLRSDDIDAVAELDQETASRLLGHAGETDLAVNQMRRTLAEEGLAQWIADARAELADRAGWDAEDAADLAAREAGSEGDATRRQTRS